MIEIGIIIDCDNDPDFDFSYCAIQTEPIFRESIFDNCDDYSSRSGFQVLGMATDGKRVGSVWGRNLAAENRFMKSWFTFNSR